MKTTWAARCPLCGGVLCKDSTNDEAQAEVDLHLAVAHGISGERLKLVLEVES